MGFESSISNEEIAAITEAISNKYGIDFTNYEIKSLKRGFARLVTKYGCESFVDLWTKIMDEPAIIPNLVDDLTVNLTQLFRNTDAWDKIANEVLTEVSKKPSIKILHAGCSSGEEVYSMAMLMKAKSMLLRSRFDAVDLSSRMIESSKAGIYKESEIDKIGHLLKDQGVENLKDYFIDQGDGQYAVGSDLKRKINFQQMNLVSDKFPGSNYDVVFCRNVMIYFDDGLKMKVLQKIHDVLDKDGFFIIGYYDNLPADHKDLFVPYDNRTKIFQKR